MSESETAGRPGKCADCRWFEAGKPPFGLCRRSPPAMQGHIAPHGDSQFQAPDRAIWPRVMIGDWCGEFSYARKRVYDREPATATLRSQEPAK